MKYLSYEQNLHEMKYLFKLWYLHNTMQEIKDKIYVGVGTFIRVKRIKRVPTRKSVLWISDDSVWLSDIQFI